MTGSRWQFSLRALLILTAVVAAVTAFAANYPSIALMIVFGTGWLLFESGAIFDLVLHLSEPRVFARHAILATVMLSVTGLLSLAICGCFVWLLFRQREVVPFLLQLMMAVIFGGLGGYCAWQLWKLIHLSANADDSESTDEQQ
jgi:hypothetical protein